MVGKQWRETSCNNSSHDLITTIITSLIDKDDQKDVVSNHQPSQAIGARPPKDEFSDIYCA